MSSSSHPDSSRRPAKTGGAQRDGPPPLQARHHRRPPPGAVALDPWPLKIVSGTSAGAGRGPCGVCAMSPEDPTGGFAGAVQEAVAPCKNSGRSRLGGFDAAFALRSRGHGWDRRPRSPAAWPSLAVCRVLDGQAVLRRDAEPGQPRRWGVLASWGCRLQHPVRHSQDVAAAAAAGAARSSRRRRRRRAASTICSADGSIPMCRRM